MFQLLRSLGFQKNLYSFSHHVRIFDHNIQYILCNVDGDGFVSFWPGQPAALRKLNLIIKLYCLLRSRNIFIDNGNFLLFHFILDLTFNTENKYANQLQI